MAVPNTINDKAINKAIHGKIHLLKRHENLNLALSSAQVKRRYVYLRSINSLNLICLIFSCWS